MKSFDTKDLKVPSTKFESFHRKDYEYECSPDGVCEVSSRKFESFHRKHSELEEAQNGHSEVSSL